jgi:hypothetical protein
MEKSSNILTSIIAIIGILSFLITTILGNLPVWLALVFITIAFILAMIVLYINGCFKYLKEKAYTFYAKIKYKINKNDFMKELDLRIDDFGRLIDHSCSYSLKRVIQDNSEIKFCSDKLDIIDILFYQYKKKFSEYNKKATIDIFIYWLEDFRTFIIAFDKCIGDIRKADNFKGESHKEFKEQYNKFINSFSSFLEKVELKLGSNLKYHFNHL